MKNLQVVLLSIALLCINAVTFAAPQPPLPEKPILLIGASFDESRTPFNDQLLAPLGGIAVGLGSYLSVGHALVRHPQLSGYVVNEAQAGATTFDRVACNPQCDPNILWQGYDKQFTKALARVSLPDGNGGLAVLNADYVVISFSNDCLHSDAFGIPQDQAQQCTEEQIGQHVENLIAVGRRAIALGLTPIYLISPSYDDLELVNFGNNAGLNWVASREIYEHMNHKAFVNIRRLLPQAVQLAVWQNYGHVDGLHPDRATVENAADMIAQFILNN